VRFPDGTQVRTSAIFDRRDDDPERDFGLYLDSRWRPTWPAEVIEWEDFRLPADREAAARQIEAAFARAQSGQVVEVGCLGGLGRTGTVLACMAVLAGVPSTNAVAWVRGTYNQRPVETPAQEGWVLWFAERLQRQTQ